MNTTLALMCPAALFVALTAMPLGAQVPTADAEEFVGTWDLEVDLNGNAVQMSLDIQDLEGNLAAELTSTFAPQPQAITDIERDGDGLLLRWTSEAAGAGLKMQLHLADGALSGSFGDDSGAFAARFTGSRTGDRGTQASTRSPLRRGSTAELAIGEGKIRIAYANLDQRSPDYAILQGLEAGEVFSFTTGRATKLLSDFSLKFGDTVIPKGNAAENYPGVYSVWLKKRQDGWSLVFNSDADIWGSQRLADADVYEVPIDWARPDAEYQQLSLDLIEAAGGGVLRILWGEHMWIAPFQIVDQGR